MSTIAQTRKNHSLEKRNKKGNKRTIIVFRILRIKL